MKKRWIFVLIVLVVILFVLFFLKNNQKGVQTENNLNNLSQKGDRLLGIDVTMSKDKDYNNAFKKAEELGIDFTTLSLNWDDFEITPGVYKNDNLQIANSYYPAKNNRLVLIINPIDTNTLHLPTDLRNKKLNDSLVITRFNNMSNFIFSQLSQVNIISTSIGNEIDIYLGKNEAEWAEYEDFFLKTSQYIKNKHPKIKVGTKITFDGLTKNHADEAISINEHASVIMITYYPLNPDFTVKDESVITGDFSKFKGLNKEVQILEIGYPSGQETGSSERKQKEFYKEMFMAWDSNPNIKAININILHDRSSEDLESFQDYYGISDKKFLNYLETLGLITYEGREKESFNEIKANAKNRGW